MALVHITEFALDVIHINGSVCGHLRDMSPEVIVRNGRGLDVIRAQASLCMKRVKHIVCPNANSRPFP